MRIEGRLETDALECAIPRGMRAEPLGTACFAADGLVFQRATDCPDIELDFYDLGWFRDTWREAQEIALSIQRTQTLSPASLLKLFALFRTRLNRLYLSRRFLLHIEMSSSDIMLVCDRTTDVCSGYVFNTAILSNLFDSSQTEASNDYVKYQAHWIKDLPAKSGLDYQSPQVERGCDPTWVWAPDRLDLFALRRVQELSDEWNMLPSSDITAAWPLLGHRWCVQDSRLVLQFSMSWRERPAPKALPRLVSGVSPLATTVSVGSSSTRFCAHVEIGARESDAPSELCGAFLSAKSAIAAGCNWPLVVAGSRSNFDIGDLAEWFGRAGGHRHLGSIASGPNVLDRATETKPSPGWTSTTYWNSP